MPAGRDDRHELETAAVAGAVVDRFHQVFEPRVDFDRRDGDRRDAVVFLVRLFELVAQRLDGAARGADLAEQRQRDRAIGLDDQLARDAVVGFGWFVAALAGEVRAAAGGERFDVDVVADLELVGPRDFVARAAIEDGDLVAFAEPIHGNLGGAGVADPFALGKLLPGDHAAGIPADFAAAAAREAVDAPDRIRGGGGEALRRGGRWWGRWSVSGQRGRQGDRETRGRGDFSDLA